MRRIEPSGPVRPWLAALIGITIAGCGPLGGCGSGNVTAGGAESPEVGHPLLVEGPVGGSHSAQDDDAQDDDAQDDDGAIQPDLPPEASRARAAALGALGEEPNFGVYGGAYGGATQAPSALPRPESSDLANLDALPGSRGGGGGAVEGEGSGEPVIDGNALGRFVPLEGAEALENFYAALRRLKAGKDEDGKVRVLLYGASHTAADIYPTYLRAYLNERFGDGGPGYVSLVQTNRWYRLLAWTVSSSKHWLIEHAQRKGSREDGHFGLLGASATSKRKSAKSQLSPRVSGPDGEHSTTYELFFLAQPGGGKIKLKIDGAAKKAVKTAAKEPRAGYASFTVKGGPHEVELSPDGSGEVRLFGMTAEYDRRGVVVDTLGINGTRASNNLKWDEASWSDNVRRRAPDLYVLAYGTNEATDSGQAIDHYKQSLAAVLDRLRTAAPQASCVLLGPGDFPEQQADGSYGSRQRLLEIVAAQAEIAADKGCAFWDAYAFMGGEGSMDLWSKATPQMGREDHIHLTRRGYVRMGMAFTDALMQGFDRRSDPQPAAEVAAK